METLYCKYKEVIKYIDKYDIYYSDKVYNYELGLKSEYIVYVFARMFNPDFVFFYFTIIFLNSILIGTNCYFVLKPIAHTALTFVVSLLLKRKIKRKRPEHKETIKRLTNLRKHEKNFSMPSGDSIQAANFAIILFHYFNTSLGFYLVPFIMFGRVFYFCHYISDTVVGALLGLTISNFIYILLNY
jgi:membrane-associated phospholipid phosphatase